MALIPLKASRFEVFTGTYLAHYMTKAIPQFHQDWYRGLDDDSIEFLAIEAGRASAKSTIASIAAPIYYICERDWPEIQTFAQSGGTTGLSTKWMKRIKTEIESNIALKVDYGLQKGDVWSQDHIQVIRNDGHVVDVYCRGKHSAARGSRGVVIIDDPQDVKDCRSETVLQADEEWLIDDILPILLDGQRLIFIGTPISPLSLLSKVKGMEEFKTMSFPAEDPPWSGHSRWPEQWSDEYLAKRLSMMGRDSYGAEYLCEPKVSGNPVFRPEWFPAFDLTSAKFRDITHTIVFKATGADCAESKSDQADYTALVTLGCTDGTDPDIYVLDVRRGRWSTTDGAAQIFLIQNEYHQHKTVVESRVKEEHGGDAMIVEIRNLERIYSKHVNLYPVKPVRDKVTRANQVQSICQGGKVHIDRHNKGQQVLLSELTMFTGSQNYHDDVLDAFVMALSAIKERSKGASGTKIKSGIGGAWA
jgi:predicted phage terminase large subunit-like protein